MYVFIYCTAVSALLCQKRSLSESHLVMKRSSCLLFLLIRHAEFTVTCITLYRGAYPQKQASTWSIINSDWWRALMASDGPAREHGNPQGILKGILNTAACNPANSHGNNGDHQSLLLLLGMLLSTVCRPGPSAAVLCSHWWTLTTPSPHSDTYVLSSWVASVIRNVRDTFQEKYSRSRSLSYLPVTLQWNHWKKPHRSDSMNEESRRAALPFRLTFCVR